MFQDFKEKWVGCKKKEKKRFNFDREHFLIDLLVLKKKMSSKSSISDSEIVPSVTIKKKNLNFVFDPNDEFYLASPAAKLLHYRTAAIIAGLLEVLTLICSVFTILRKFFQ